MAQPIEPDDTLTPQHPPATITHSNVWPCCHLDLDPRPSKLNYRVAHLSHQLHYQSKFSGIPALFCKTLC